VGKGTIEMDKFTAATGAHATCGSRILLQNRFVWSLKLNNPTIHMVSCSLSKIDPKKFPV